VAIFCIKWREAFGSGRDAIGKWHFPLYDTIMSAKVTIDRAGRVVLPKKVRDSMRLSPGTTLELQSEGEQITLKPVRPQATLRKESGIWVFQGPQINAPIADLIDQAREKRSRELTD
jgi:AbrB family looped-hinge helix DNA binding protein